MRKLGMVTTLFLIIVTCGVAALIIHSLPDIKRYLKIRKM